MREVSETSKKSAQFWDAQPCDALDSFASRARMRYARNAWLPKVLAAVAQQKDVVEVGCGQGTDAIEICRQMAPRGNYRGFDHSAVSVAAAQAAKEEAAPLLKVEPTFETADALQFPLADASVECVYSMGVIHHIADTEGALSEIRRILRPGGRCFIMIYRTARAFSSLTDLLGGFPKFRESDSMVRLAKEASLYDPTSFD